MPELLVEQRTLPRPRCAVAGDALGQRLPRRGYRRAARQSRGPVPALSLPHHHELRQGVPEGPQPVGSDRRAQAQAGRAAGLSRAMSASPIILHHFDQSPFSEKIRLIFGLKKLAWTSVRISRIMPRPDLMPMTGGYRRTPVMQIGADIYCDTQCIMRELERRFPQPSLLPKDY